MVIRLSALLLMAVFRSVLIPLKAVVLNLLSVGAALGIVTLVFGDGMLGVQGGGVEAFVPVMIFAIVFGLSMDYEVQCSPVTRSPTPKQNFTSTPLPRSRLSSPPTPRRLGTGEKAGITDH